MIAGVASILRRASTAVSRTLLPEAGRRFRRAWPGRLPLPLQVFIVSGWCLTGGLCVFIVSYAVAPVDSWQMPGLYLVACGASFAVAACGALTRLPNRSRHRLPAAIALLLMSLLPVAVARAGQDRAVFVVAASCFFVASLALAWPTARSAEPRPGAALGRTWPVALLLLIAWVVPSLKVLLDSTTGQPWDNLAVAAFIPALGALVLPFYDLSSIAAVSSAAIARRSSSLARLGRYNSVALVLVLVAAKAAYLFARVTWEHDLFGDTRLWAFSSQPLVSWLHAAALAGAICLVAVRSTARPLGNRGWTRAVLLLSLVPALPFLLDLLRFMAFSVALAISPGGAAEFVDRWLISEDWNERTPWLWLMVGVAAFIGGAAAWLGRTDRWNAGIVLLSLGCASILPQAFAPMLGTRAALPTQVDVVITVAVLGILIGRLVRGSDTDRKDHAASNRMLMRLLVIPFTVIHAVALVPAVWESDLFPFLVVLAVVTTALTLPLVPADPARHARVLITLLAVEMTGLTTVALIALTNSQVLTDGLGATTGLSLLVLAIPLGGALSCRTESLE